nr:AraC family transcriptional regulator [Sinorhizobium sp. 7-81]
MAAYLGSDPVTGTSLAQIASSLPQLDMVDHRLLRPERSPQIVIVDCRELEEHKHARVSLSSELVQLALVAEGSLDRRAVFSNGYSDYLLWPLIEEEVLSRLTACVAEIARRSAPPFFSADALVQDSCVLLAQRIDQQITLSKLARTVGTNKTTLVNRFEASFGCGPMTWLRHYRMTLAAARLRSGHESVATVAASLGYENSNNFSTAFKAFHGLSPLRYRKMVAGKEKSVRRKG